MDATVCRVRPTWEASSGYEPEELARQSLEDSDERPTLSHFSALAIGLAGSFVHAPDKPNPASTPGPGEPTLAEVRRLTERFRDVNAALAEGYIRDSFDRCETAEAHSDHGGSH